MKSAKILATVLTMVLLTGSAQAMSFSSAEEIGGIGMPPQSPYHGFIVRGATVNSGKAIAENFADPEEKDGKLKTYKAGVAGFGKGEQALYCKYEFESSDRFHDLKFGGKDDYVFAVNGNYRELYKLNNDAALPVYAIYHNYCVTDLQIMGPQKDGNWVVYIDSKKISDSYFDGKDAYKEDGGIMYDRPVCQGDTIVVTYYRWHWKGDSPKEGEFRFKWDENAQWFGIEQVVYQHAGN